MTRAGAALCWDQHGPPFSVTLFNDVLNNVLRIDRPTDRPTERPHSLAPVGDAKRNLPLTGSGAGGNDRLEGTSVTVIE